MNFNQCVTFGTLLLQKDGGKGEGKKRSVDHIRSSLIWKSDIYSVQVGAINGGKASFWSTADKKQFYHLGFSQVAI